MFLSVISQSFWESDSVVLNLVVVSFRWVGNDPKYWGLLESQDKTSAASDQYINTNAGIFPIY